MPRIELGASHMRSERSTTELHPLTHEIRSGSHIDNNVTYSYYQLFD